MNETARSTAALLAVRETGDKAPRPGMTPITIQARPFGSLDPRHWSRTAWAGQTRDGDIYLLCQVGTKWMALMFAAHADGGVRVAPMLNAPASLATAVKNSFGKARLAPVAL